MAVPISKKSDTKVITDILDDWFIDNGLPVSIRTDGGPQFRGPFKAWCAKHHNRHELASAYNHAECAVREVKKLLAKTPSYTAFRRALRSYRNCPRYDGLSPAQWCVGRRQRTDAVAFPAAYDRVLEATITRHEAERRKKARKKEAHENKSSRYKSWLEPGQHVISQHVLTKRWDQHAVILKRLPYERSYVIRINGREYLRNRRFLRPKPGPSQIDPTKHPIHRGAISTKTPTSREVVPMKIPMSQEVATRPEEPRRIYPLRERRQTVHYQAAAPKPKKRKNCN